MLNLTALLELQETVLANPAHHDQDSWINARRDSSALAPPLAFTQEADDPTTCGTTLCLAGWTSWLAGAWWPNVDATEWIKTPEGEWSSPEQFAADRLGLDEHQIAWLFYCTNANALPRLQSLIDLAREQDPAAAARVIAGRRSVLAARA